MTFLIFIVTAALAAAAGFLGGILYAESRREPQPGIGTEAHPVHWAGRGRRTGRPLNLNPSRERWQKTGKI